MDSNGTEESPLAEVLPLPSTRLLCVEYPGFVKNVDRAVVTLGGEDAIQKAVRDRPEFLEAPLWTHLTATRIESNVIWVHAVGSFQPRKLPLAPPGWASCIDKQSSSQATCATKMY